MAKTKKRPHVDLINIRILIPGQYRYKKISMAVISLPGDTLPQKIEILTDFCLLFFLKSTSRQNTVLSLDIQ